MTYCRKDLAEYENLELAWKRIQTSTGYEYKKLSEGALSGFGWNFEQNLKSLSSEINEKIYKPTRTSKYYRPKKSDLVRPITILSIKDGLKIPKYELRNMIEKLKNHIPYAFAGFDKCHHLRCEVLEIHAYSEFKKSLNVSSSSRFRERDKLKLLLANSYEVLFEHIESKHITKLLKAV